MSPASVKWTSKMSEKCPFCGCKRAFCYTETSMDGSEITATIKCERCGANVYYADDTEELAIARAIQKWGTRA